MLNFNETAPNVTKSNPFRQRSHDGGNCSNDGRFTFERIHNTKEHIFYEKAEKHKSKERMIFKKALFQGNDQGGNDLIPPPRPHRYSGGQPSIT